MRYSHSVPAGTNFGRRPAQVSLATALLLAVSPAALWAQSGADSASDTTLDEVLVTAQFRTQRLQDTPIAITAQTGEMLEERGIADVERLRSVTPNLNISKSSPVFGSSIAVFMRGIGQYDANFAYEPGVGIYLDDVYYGSLTAANFQLADLDRVEVLRGPQGTLSGKNSEGGSLKLYSQKPQGSNDGYLQATYGKFNRIDIKGAFDRALIKDVLALRVSGFSAHRDGYVDLLDFKCDQPALAADIPLVGGGNGLCKIGSEGGQRMWGLRAALRWTPSESVEGNFIVDRTVDNSEPAPSSLFYAVTAFGPTLFNPGDPNSAVYDSRFIPSNPYTSYSTYTNKDTGYHLDPITHTNSWGASGDLNFKLAGDLSLRSISAYRKVNTDSPFDQDGSPFSLALVHLHTPFDQFTQELRLSGKVGEDRVNWTVGGFYYRASGRIQNRIAAGTFLDFITDDPVKTTSKSAFAHAVFQLFPNFNITAGLRYTDDKKTYDFNRYGPNGPPSLNLVALNNLPVQSFTGNKTDYRLGIDYRWNDSLMTYAQVSTGFKGGGVNAKPFTAGQAIPFDPESLKNYEVGLKSDLLNNTLRLNVAAFFNKYKDIVLVNASGFCGVGDDPLTTTCSFQSALPFNAGDADIKGVEAELEYHPVEGLALTASFSNLDFKYKRLAPAAIASSIDLTDIAPFTPKTKIAAGAAYTMRLPSGASLTPRVDWQRTSKTFSDPANYFKLPFPGIPEPTVPLYLLPSYSTVDARVAYDSADGDWQVALSGTNLSNKVYFTSGFAFYFTGTGQHIIAPPREWALTVRHKF
jgi:iron complex outermembrane receptor protein